MLRLLGPDTSLLSDRAKSSACTAPPLPPALDGKRARRAAGLRQRAPRGPAENLPRPRGRPGISGPKNIRKHHQGQVWKIKGRSSILDPRATTTTFGPASGTAPPPRRRTQGASGEAVSVVW
eukprot:2934851-Pyramimonas_sp.AAC.1